MNLRSGGRWEVTGGEGGDPVGGVHPSPTVSVDQGWGSLTASRERLYLKTARWVCSFSSPLTKQEKRPKDSVPETQTQGETDAEEAEEGKYWKA